MAYEFLLPLATYPDPTPKAGLPRVMDLAATLGGRLTALIHQVDIPPVRNALAEALLNVGALTAEAEAVSRARGIELIAEVTERAGRMQLPLELETIECRLEQVGDRVALRARTFDMTLFVRDSDSPADIAEAVLFGSGGPVILFPDREAPAHLEHIAIGWDGSRAAARAVRDALPVLTRASSVSILTLGDDKPISADSVENLRRFLARHGIEAMRIEAATGTRPAGETLQEAALDHGAGLLVMGAYGRNRVREFILGGATSAVLGHVRLPVLMSH